MVTVTPNMPLDPTRNGCPLHAAISLLTLTSQPLQPVQLRRYASLFMEEK
jgi:hypothetical protein